MTLTNYPVISVTIPKTLSRMTLRLADENDAPAIVDHLTRNRAHFVPTDPPVPDGYFTEKFWRDRIPKSHKEFETDQAVRFFLFRDVDSKVLATASFTQIARGPLQACYLGYGLDEKEQGKGIMTAALSLAIAYMFEERNLHRIMANHLPENQRSARVLKRLGFEVDGLAKQYLLINGTWRDHVLNSLINPDWRAS